MPTWYQRYPVTRFDKVHLAHVVGCSNSGDGGGSNGRWSGIHDGLVASVSLSLSSSDVTWKASV